MKTLHRLLPAALAIGALIATVAPAEAQARPAVIVTVPAPPVWVTGHWSVEFGRRVWVEGTFKPIVKRPARRVWVSGQWVGQGRARHWVSGHYR